MSDSPSESDSQASEPQRGSGHSPFLSVSASHTHKYLTTLNVENLQHQSFTIVFKLTFIQRPWKTAGLLAVQTCPPPFLYHTVNTILLATEAQIRGAISSFFPFFSFQEVFNVLLPHAKQTKTSALVKRTL